MTDAGWKNPSPVADVPSEKHRIAGRLLVSPPGATKARAAGYDHGKSPHYRSRVSQRDLRSGVRALPRATVPPNKHADAYPAALLAALVARRHARIGPDDAARARASNVAWGDAIPADIAARCSGLRQ